MSTTKVNHTPGPWEAHEGIDYNHIYGGEYDHSENPLASVASKEDLNLISAAPDLLKALEYLMRSNKEWFTKLGSKEVVYPTGDITQAVFYAKKAIKKATE